MRAPLVCLRKEGEGRVRPDVRPGAGGEGGRMLACARCGQHVTTAAARTEVDGAHEHTFANPHGFFFHIGCFAQATGCVPVGPASTEWTWFPAHSWQIEHCAACGEHLGWLFRSSERTFHGFVLDRLREVEEG